MLHGHYSYCFAIGAVHHRALGSDVQDEPDSGVANSLQIGLGNLSHGAQQRAEAAKDLFFSCRFLFRMLFG